MPSWAIANQKAREDKAMAGEQALNQSWRERLGFLGQAQGYNQSAMQGQLSAASMEEQARMQNAQDRGGFFGELMSAGAGFLPFLL
jgi:hypothetical protein